MIIIIIMRTTNNNNNSDEKTTRKSEKTDPGVACFNQINNIYDKNLIRTSTSVLQSDAISLKVTQHLPKSHNLSSSHCYLSSS